MIRRLMLAGADAFRINMSHGTHAQKAKLVDAIRALEKEFHRPTTILFDLQGPKLRVGSFEGGSAELHKGDRFVLDPQQGDKQPDWTFDAEDSGQSPADRVNQRAVV